MKSQISGSDPLSHHRYFDGRFTQDAFAVSFSHALLTGAADFFAVTGAMAMVGSVVWLYLSGFHWTMVVIWFFALPPVFTAFTFRREYERAVSMTTTEETTEEWQWQDQVKRVETVTEQKHSLTVRLEHDTGCKYAYFPYEPLLLQNVAHALLVEGLSFSRPKLCGFVDDLSEARFAKVQAWALQNDFAVWNNPSNHRKGVSLTDTGRLVFSKALHNDGIKQLEMLQ